MRWIYRNLTKRWIATAVIVNVVILVAGLAVFAYAQNLTVKGTTTSHGDAHFFGNVTIDGELFAGSGASGTVATRYGNDTAPAGTELLYSGIVVGQHYNHASGARETCLAPNAAHTTAGDANHYMYTSNSRTMSGTSIVTSTVKCAKYFSKKPVYTIWGDNVCKFGWSVLYTGVMMGGHYSHAGGSGNSVCMDADNYDGTLTLGYDGMIFYGSTGVAGTLPVGYATGKRIVCAVCQKN
ncbi:MAG: hypothetical protein MJE77_14230 [Proteobacteria bacterium]|nr:hypothetical protein [Pseudomonadota bacterium]